MTTSAAQSFINVGELHLPSPLGERVRVRGLAASVHECGKN